MELMTIGNRLRSDVCRLQSTAWRDTGGARGGEAILCLWLPAIGCRTSGTQQLTHNHDTCVCMYVRTWPQLRHRECMTQAEGFDLQVSGYGKSHVYHGNDEYCLLSDMQSAMKIFSKVRYEGSSDTLLYPVLTTTTCVLLCRSLRNWIRPPNKAQPCFCLVILSLSTHASLCE